MFGAACNSSGALFVGCIPACFGMFSAMIACLIVNWKALEALPQLKCALICTLIVFSFCLMLNSSSNLTNAPQYHPHEVWANWGGFMMGLALGMVMVPRARERDVNAWGKLCGWIGYVWIVMYLGILLPLFFTVYNPPEWKFNLL